MRKEMEPRYRNYTQIREDAHQKKMRLLEELGVSNNTLAEMAINALATAHDRRCEEPAA
jgi:predicted hydrolase (HD superfamily)